MYRACAHTIVCSITYREISDTEGLRRGIMKKMLSVCFALGLISGLMAQGKPVIDPADPNTPNYCDFQFVS